MLLPFGVAVIAFGLMLLLSVMLQTASGALNLFKYMAIGLGGGLYYAVPVMVIWLGCIMVVSAKRYVSLYPFFISLLLLMSLGAFLTLTLRVNDQTYPHLMHYIKNLNSMRGAPYPDSMGEYLHEAYHRYKGLRSDNHFYPGGGVLGMLVAYPLFVTLGNLGATVLDAFLIIALVFALLRVSPVRLFTMLNLKISSLSARQAAGGSHPASSSAAQQPVLEEQPVQQQMYPEDIYTQSVATSTSKGQWQQTMDPVFTQDTDSYTDPALQNAGWGQTAPYPTQHEATIQNEQPARAEPGFIPQTSDLIYEEFVQPVYQPVEKPARQTRRKTEPAFTAQTIDGPAQTEPAFRQPIEERMKVSPLPQQALDAPASAAQSKPSAGAQQVAEDEQPNKPAAQEPVRAPVANQPVVPVNTDPAVRLSGQRVPIQQKTASKSTSLDGMTRNKEPQQIKLALDDYEVPPKRLLMSPPPESQTDTTQEDLKRGEKLIETLKSFQITAHLHDIVHGPTVTRFAIRLAEGINVNKLRNVMDNLTIELKAKGDIRAEMPIPGTSFVGLEVSNDKTTKVYLRDVLESTRMKENPSPTAVALGKDITGTPIVCELMDMPHLLIAGATGSGKSVCINSIICSILYRASPRNVRLIMVDPKFVELQPYNDVPHLMMPVITDAKKATAALDWVCQEMDERYQILVDAGVRNLDAYNKRLGPDEEPLPRIIVIVDEMADLMTTSGKMIEDSIKRITAKARAAGICLILATQRPSVNIITGVIKANIPGRIAFRVSSPFDSKTILDNTGAEKLLGYGDMLFRSTTREPIRVQGCFVSDKDVEQTVEYMRSRNKANYNLDLVEHVEKSESGDTNGSMGEGMDGSDSEFDELLPQAIEMAVEAGQMSISMLQRVLRVGYARSGRLIDEMERRGIITPSEGTKPRKTLMTREQYIAYQEEADF
ncbi:MAG: hypothetical protein GXZ04_08240 [Clostridiales bacterium]|nr:hypothetical protein [Clostridiales bacterium]